MKSELSEYLRAGEFAVIAHRGGSLEAPENTLEAFDRAARAYSNMSFELDIHRTRDGQIVVIHDSTLDRTTSGHGRIQDMNYSEMEKLDAAYYFSPDRRDFPFRGKKIKIPLLRDVLEAFPQTRISIEFKQPLMEKDVVALVRELKASGRVVLSSERHAVLEETRKLAPEICSGFSGREIFKALLAARFHAPFFTPRKADVYQIPVQEKGIRIFSQNFLKNAHKWGKHVHLWTINDEATMRQLSNAGVDGIITDAPRLLLHIAREMKKI